jgi:hypothetical protein
MMSFEFVLAQDEVEGGTFKDGRSAYAATRVTFQPALSKVRSALVEADRGVIHSSRRGGTVWRSKYLYVRP